MFETVAPEAFVPRTRRVFYETLPVSIAVHVVAVGSVLASMIWNIALPTQSPKVSVAYSLTQVPDPPPPPQPVAVAAPAVADAAGSKNGMTGGEVGGTGKTLGTNGGITFGEDGRVYVDRTVKLPLKEVDHEYPHYPEAARKNRLEGTCVVRYTVGKDGRITNIIILNHASDPMFDEETLNTLRSWRYRPMMMNGKPVEVVHEVEVNYQYIVR